MVAAAAVASYFEVLRKQLLLLPSYVMQNIYMNLCQLKGQNEALLHMIFSMHSTLLYVLSNSFEMIILQILLYYTLHL